ncbi:MAG: RNA polymerase sporulation sigma factor SigK [Oscillospiraceae bacterium]|nr:RNA polymerase sporulation sigma factor SigK [Oscillospiraceae bacterium]
MFASLVGNFFSGIIFLVLHVVNQNAFPKPLSTKDEKRLIELMKDGDNKAKTKLIEHNLRLVAHITKKFSYLPENNEDLISVGTIGLIKGINTFNDSKGIKLSSYTSRCIENEILMYFRTVKKSSLDVSMEEPIETGKDGGQLTLIETLTENTQIFDQIANKIDAQKILKFIEEKLNKREKIVIKLRYGIGDGITFTQQQVAKKLKISRSYVSRIEKKILFTLRRLMHG